MTYGWAILVVLIVLGSLFALGVFDSTPTGLTQGTIGPFKYELKVNENQLEIFFQSKAVKEATIQSITVDGQLCTLDTQTINVDNSNIITCTDINVDKNKKLDVVVDLDYLQKGSSVSHNLVIEQQAYAEDSIIEEEVVVEEYCGDSICNAEENVVNCPNDCGDNLVGYWGFEEGSGSTAYDSSSYGNDGIINGDPVYSTDSRNGDYSISFDGVNDYISIGNPLITSSSNNYSVSVWFKVGSQSTGNKELLAQWYGSSGNDFYIGTRDYDNIRFSDYWSSIDVGTWTTNEWHHIVGVSSDAGAYLYFDGELKASRSVLSLIPSGNMYIGRQGTCGCEYWDGLIDSPMVFDKALTIEEIQEIYNA